jgi:RNA polymerase sigma-70 factor (ECF subfamily)
MYQEKPDEELITLYLKGDTDALNVLIQKHLNSVYSFVRSIVYSDTDAEDTTQETFVKLWKNIKKYKEGNNFKSWLLTIAKNTAYDFLRKRKNIPFSQFENDDGGNVLIDTLADTEASAIELIIFAENKETIKKALEHISPLYREVLLLRHGEDMTFEEIGKILHKPLNTVKSQHRRALIELRNIIAPKKPL